MKQPWRPYDISALSSIFAFERYGNREGATHRNGAFSLAYSFGHGSSLSREEKVQQTQIAEKNQKKMYKEKKKKEEGILLNFFE
jgi:hypothetical protein